MNFLKKTLSILGLFFGTSGFAIVEPQRHAFERLSDNLEKICSRPSIDQVTFEKAALQLKKYLAEINENHSYEIRTDALNAAIGLSEFALTLREDQLKLKSPVRSTLVDTSIVRVLTSLILFEKGVVASSGFMPFFRFNMDDLIFFLVGQRMLSFEPYTILLSEDRSKLPEQLRALMEFSKSLKPDVDYSNDPTK